MILKNFIIHYFIILFDESQKTKKTKTKNNNFNQTGENWKFAITHQGADIACAVTRAVSFFFPKKKKEMNPKNEKKSFENFERKKLKDTRFFNMSLYPHIFSEIYLFALLNCL